MTAPRCGGRLGRMKAALKSGKKPIDRTQLALMTLATGVCGVLAVLGAILAIFTPLVFDRAGNVLNPIAWLGFAFAALFWVVCLLGPLAGWILWRKGATPLAWAAMVTPLAWGAATMTLLQFVPV
ncbi:MAG: hypothetical protein B7Z12_11530 [Caulobacter vibrioides]|uniref:Uncharacterized protein n=1 Tax=Caulobacter vibrioides TaxID=155892 RepID=A0A258D4L7_CAUVI|nr:MAG: hypothetical protein B7Z12_11530 [Caulobacter vibrioides]